jgi:hypothetical protein
VGEKASCVMMAPGSPECLTIYQHTVGEEFVLSALTDRAGGEFEWTKRTRWTWTPMRDRRRSGKVRVR